MNLGFIMVGLVFLISISVLSCQADEADDYFQQAEDVISLLLRKPIRTYKKK